MKVTIPVTVGGPLTEAVNSTPWPTVDGFGALPSVVVVPACCTVKLTVVDGTLL
jgi:hypothetical protein